MKTKRLFRGISQLNRDIQPGSIRAKAMVLILKKEQDARTTNEALQRLCSVAAP